jgi:hypothetical protein
MLKILQWFVHQTSLFMDPQAPLKNPDKKTPILSGAKGKKQSRNQMAGELGFFMKQPEISSLGNYGRHQDVGLLLH